MSNDKKEYSVNGSDFYVVRPSPQQISESQKYYNKTFGEALQSGAVLRAALDKHLLRQKVWDDEKEKEYNELNKKIRGLSKKLALGGIKLSKGKGLALKIRDMRIELRDLTSGKLLADSSTAEGQADNSRFNYLCSSCIMEKESEESYYKNYDSFVADFVNDIAQNGAAKLASLIYDVDDDPETKLPENIFLKQHKFIDDKFRLVDNKGRFVDDEGRLIDDKGRYINEEGKFVDIHGDLVDENGNYILDSKPFLDEKGKPIKV